MGGVLIVFPRGYLLIIDPKVRYFFRLLISNVIAAYIES